MGQTDAGGGKKKKMKERARRKGRKEGRRSGNLFARTRNWFWFSFSGWTDGGPAARRAAAAAIIERGIHAFLPRCTPTSTPTYAVRALYKFGFFASLLLSLHPLAAPVVASSHRRPPTLWTD